MVLVVRASMVVLVVPAVTPMSMLGGIVKRLVQHRCSRGDQGPVIGHTLGACKGGGKGVIT
ncbi:hypothetical protein H7H37_24815 [Mycolicibacterium insubricum]|nr:hypothetical protein [Mycolicibacterium insubricum]